MYETNHIWKHARAAAGRRALRAIAAAVAILLAIPTTSWCEEQEDDVFEMSLDQLASLDIEVTSVSKKEQKISEAPAAIAVITGEDIRRSGATSIPEALRMIPGVHVAQISAHSWSVTARGFSFEFANKLLVMIDGRSVYTPLFAGVYWDSKDTLLADIDRIEVIRGPGATVWGANAVNGVINIITKSADKTQGVLATALGGNYSKFDGGARYGGSIGDDFHYRVYGKYFDRDEFPAVGGGDANDAWNQGRGGFRTDWAASDADHVTFQGDVYAGTAGDTVTSVIPDDSITINPPPPGATLPLMDFNVLAVEKDADLSGGNLLGRWSHAFGETMSSDLQLFWDRTVRSAVFFKETRDTIDLDFQHDFSLPYDLSVIWGLGYRWTRGSIDKSTFTLSMDPPIRNDHLVTGFAQLEWATLDDRLRLTLGTKLEHNDYSGFEIQPSLRGIFLPNEQHSFWASLSRAVRTPSWVEDDMTYTVATSSNNPYQTDPTAPDFLPIPMAIQVQGSGGAFKSEVLYAVEAGYRFNWTEKLKLDLAAFWNRYTRLGNEQAAVAPEVGATYMVMPLYLDNGVDGETYGLEALATWQVLERWRLTASYSLVKMDLEAYLGNEPSAVGQTPEHMVGLRSYLNLPCDLRFDTMVYWVDKVDSFDVDSYWRLDLGLGWRPLRWLDLAVVGQNLTKAKHQEFQAQLGTTSLVPRSVYGKATISF